MAILSKACKPDNFESHNSLKLSFTNARDLSLENSADSYLCFRLALLHSVPYFFFLYRSPSLSLCTVFDSISSNIDEVLSINPSANVFVFGDFNIHHKDWLTYSGGTDRPGKLCYNFSISNDLTQIVNIPTQIPDCDSHSPALLDLLISSDASICSTMTFPPLGNSDHVVVSVSIGFPINSKQDKLFHRVAYDYSRADWDALHDHLRDVPWGNVFKLSASAAANKFCEWVQVGIDVYIPHCKYQVKPDSSPWFSAVCAAAIVHRNHSFCLYQQNKSSESKVKFRQASNRCKRVLEAAKLVYATKTKKAITSQKLGSRDFWQIANSVLKCCHVWAGAPSWYLELLDKLQKWICRTVGPSLAASLEPLAHGRHVASLKLVSAIFIKFLFFHQMIALQKL